VHLHDARLDQLQAREEPADFTVRARCDRGSGLLVVPPYALCHLLSEVLGAT
jgi:hypothetical protein